MPSNKRARQKAARRAKLEAMAKARRRKRFTIQGVLAAVVIIAVVLILAFINTKPTKPIANVQGTKNGCPPSFISTNRVTKFSAPPPMGINLKKTYYADFNTTAGNITVKLLPSLAPKTVNNFIFLACHQFYNTTIFHRVVTNFVDQGGDPTGTGSGGPGYTIPDEYPTGSNIKDPYQAGQLAMANSGQGNSGGSQFFFIDSASGASQLNQVISSPSVEKYTIFGQVVSGMNVVQKINAGGSPSSQGTPKIVYKINSVTIKTT
jgi:cyclophilin family peptidyl-prolyl cis-trans isomerase